MSAACPNQTRPSVRRFALPALLLGLAAGGTASAYDCSVPYPRSWWNPNGAPVSGNFSNTSNWFNSCRPLTDAAAANGLDFTFASPTAFTANNDLQSGLRVAYIFVSDAPRLEVTGQPMRFLNGSYIYKYSPNSTYTDSQALVIRTPMQGSSGVTIEDGFIEIDPPSGSQHTLSGGITQENGIVSISTAWKLGSLSNTYRLEDGTFRVTGSTTISIPFTLLGGKIDTATTGTVRMALPIDGDFAVAKTGPGTLALDGSNSSGSIDWTVEQGTLAVGQNAAGAESIYLEPGTTLQLLAANTIGPTYGPGHIELNGQTLTLPVDAAYRPSALHGTGTLHMSGPSIMYAPNMQNFSGDIRVTNGQLSGDLPGTLDADVMVESPGAYRVTVPITVNTLDGDGTLNLAGANAHLTFGTAAMIGAYNGPIVGVAGAVLDKVGPEFLTLDGDVTGYNGELRVSEGEMSVPNPGAPAATVHVEPGATFHGLAFAGIAGVTGSGTLRVASSGYFTVGEDGTSSTFDGTLTGLGLANLRKRGTGTLTMTGDTSQFQGLFDVLGGTARFQGGDIMPAAQNVLVNGLSILAGYGALEVPFLNQGSMVSDVTDESLVIAGTNDTFAVTRWNFGGTIAAMNGGRVELRDVTVTQDSAGTIRADGATVDIAGMGATVHDGTLESINGGVIAVDDTTLTLEDNSLHGSVAFRGASTINLSNAQLALAAGDTMHIEADGMTTEPYLRGTGTIDLGGTLTIEFADGYTPSSGNRLTIVDTALDPGLAVTGAFETLNVPTSSLAAGAVKVPTGGAVTQQKNAGERTDLVSMPGQEKRTTAKAITVLL